MNYSEFTRLMCSKISNNDNNNNNKKYIKRVFKSYNIMTPKIVGYYKGVEISCDSISKFMGVPIGITFTTDNDKISDYNKCFSYDSYEESYASNEIFEYIDKVLNFSVCGNP